MTDVDTILESIGRRRGCLVSGGVVDFDKARRIILQDYRNTKLGTITLDKVDEEPYYPLELKAKSLRLVQFQKELLYLLLLIY